MRSYLKQLIVRLALWGLIPVAFATCSFNGED